MGGCRSEGNRKEWREEIGREGEGGRERTVCVDMQSALLVLCVVALTWHPLGEYVGLDQFSHS